VTPMYIALVEDNPADAHLLQRALQATDMPVEIAWFQDGAEALEHFASAPRCDLLLLDLNLPRLTGLDVLEKLRSQEELRTLPVVVLSGSCDPADIERSYRSSANSYICKPVHVDDVFAMAGKLLQYWSSCATIVPRKKSLNANGELDFVPPPISKFA
jgi:CheY-like chemotaxis protein